MASKSRSCTLVISRGHLESISEICLIFAARTLGSFVYSEATIKLVRDYLSFKVIAR